ncbi:MAG: DCC1-like thiol-disulfide oxidoreductase family protein [Leptospirales bacterium]
MSKDDQKQWTMVYDSGCKVCSKGAGTLRKLDKNRVFLFVDFEEYVKNIETDETLSNDLHLISPSGEIFSGAEAIDKIVEILPMAKPVRWVLRKSFLVNGAVPAYRIMKTFRRVCSRCP